MKAKIPEGPRVGLAAEGLLRRVTQLELAGEIEPGMQDQNKESRSHGNK
jgi:hypothetical protein